MLTLRCLAASHAGARHGAATAIHTQPTTHTSVYPLLHAPLANAAVYSWRCVPVQRHPTAVTGTASEVLPRLLSSAAQRHFSAVASWAPTKTAAPRRHPTMAAAEPPALQPRQCCGAKKAGDKYVPCPNTDMRHRLPSKVLVNGPMDEWTICNTCYRFAMRCSQMEAQKHAKCCNGPSEPHRARLAAFQLPAGVSFNFLNGPRASDDNAKVEESNPDTADMAMHVGFGAGLDALMASLPPSQAGVLPPAMPALARLDSGSGTRRARDTAVPAASAATQQSLVGAGGGVQTSDLSSPRPRAYSHEFDHAPSPRSTKRLRTSSPSDHHRRTGFPSGSWASGVSFTTYKISHLPNSTSSSADVALSQLPRADRRRLRRDLAGSGAGGATTDGFASLSLPPSAVSTNSSSVRHLGPSPSLTMLGMLGAHGDVAPARLDSSAAGAQPLGPARRTTSSPQLGQAFTSIASISPHDSDGSAGALMAQAALAPAGVDPFLVSLPLFGGSAAPQSPFGDRGTAIDGWDDSDFGFYSSC